ncbi:hypothetical protein, partial [Nonomuraea sp. NPDC049695]|uniref:hypothetical protein n=1 Tax=Nonomuraea sp. NPDC049695 TaxID=3154734 RepID=UPI00341A3685
RTSHDREETSLIGPAEDRCGIEPSPRFQGIDTRRRPPFSGSGGVLVVGVQMNVQNRVQVDMQMPVSVR